MNTIQELEAWLVKNCYSFQELTIGHHFAPEGIVIEEDGNRFNWCYSERGNKRILKSFDSEKELVDYAMDQLTTDKWYKAHIIAFTFDEEKIKELEAYLSERKIGYERNDIPNYTKGRRAYRIFVFGCDIKKTEHLKARYMYA